ncbi:MAG: uracil-DNA glycosylase [Candidatus Omnitrophota bacterium]
MSDELRQMMDNVKAYVELEKMLGMSEIEAPAGKKTAIGKDAKQQLLHDLKREATACKECGLCGKRTNLVFGEGNPNAKLMFVGEAPGADEDLQGRPFVGRAGQLLTKIIQAMGMRREDVYIANILKCRPPNNRSPLPTEVASCTAILTRQVEIIGPRVICALGKFAGQFLANSADTISNLRGKTFHYRDVILIPTFHPAYLLRNPNDKGLVWRDMKKIMKILKEQG